MQHEYFALSPRQGEEGVTKTPTGPYLRVVPLGGCGEIGRNMSVYEINDDIVVIDAGVQFPEEEMLGVDLVINDISYLLERKSKVRGLLLTHAHEDHIGGVAYLLAQLNVPVFGTDVTIALLRGKLKEHELQDHEVLRVVKSGEENQVGEFDFCFIA